MKTLDPRRVARALRLKVQPLDDGVFLVTGGREPHRVERGRCDCYDARVRRVVCKHRIARHLFEALHPSVREALRELAEARSCSTSRGPAAGKPLPTPKVRSGDRPRTPCVTHMHASGRARMAQRGARGRL
jgi:hypothetical protein